MCIRDSQYIERTGRFPSHRSRWCTQEWKIRPMRRWYRNELHATRSNPVVEHIGFAHDEAWRASGKQPPQYVRRVTPLIDDHITREGCFGIIRDAGLPIPPKSACTLCFFQTKREVRAACQSDPEAFSKLVTIEEASPRYPQYRLFARKWDVRSITEQGRLTDFDNGGEPGWVTGSCMSGSCGM